MNRRTQHQSWLPGIHRRVATTALALAIILLAGVATRSAQAQTWNEAVLYTFTGGADGGFPQTGMALDARGSLYGTTMGGGAFGQGTVFQVGGGGTKIVLYSFTGGADGAGPGAGLMWAQGNLYGTTVWGGASGVGVVFKVNKTGKETVLHSFTGGIDGACPQGVLMRDAQGNLYGTTSGGGAAGNGTVFKVDTAGEETVLHSFTGTPDGAVSYGGLVLDPQGNLYGTTSGGGAAGQGTAFKVDTTGNETVLYSFGGTGGDGANPGPGLVRDAQGNLYGTTSRGGASGWGTVFKVDTTGNETVLYSFIANGMDGLSPYAGVVRDKQGNLFGTTFLGGNIVRCNQKDGYNGCGTVFMLNTTGQETVLYSFTDWQDGGNPWAGLVQDKQGNLYGTTYIGGDMGEHMGTPCWPVGCGTVFKIQIAATTTTLSSSPNPSTYGEPVFFSATVNSSAGAPPDGETVTFMNGATVLGTGTLSGGSATFVTGTPLTAGASEIAAVYSGDPNFAGSTSKKLRQLVKKAVPTITLSSSPNPSVYLQPVSFTAVLMSSAGWPLDGETVAFMEGAREVGSAPMYSGVAAIMTEALPVGSHNIKAVYAGDSDYHSSHSNAVKQVVNKAEK